MEYRPVPMRTSVSKPTMNLFFMDKEIILFIMDKNLISNCEFPFQLRNRHRGSVSVSPDKVDIKSVEAVE